MKRSLWTIIGFLFLSLCGFGAFFVYFLFSSTVSAEKGVVYYLKPGTSKKVMLEELAGQGIISYPWLYSLYMYPQARAHLKTGEYLFHQGSTPISIWQQVTSGRGLLQHPFTIVPGWSFSQLRQQLNQAQGLRHTTVSLTDTQVMETLGQSTFAPEGEFYPETYYYTRGMSDLVILKRAFDLMQHKLKAEWAKRAADLPYQNEYQALIAASLIEKEAYLSKERPMIAGVLVNRLKHDMLLQFDPTVIYGMGTKYTGKIHKEDLQTDTPYNTYVHKGLPPTPIAMPSLASLQAALHPEQSDYFYFVAKGDGSHQFSKTLNEHNDAVVTSIKNHEATQAKTQNQTYFNHEKVKRYIPPIKIASNQDQPFVFAYGPEALIRL